MSYNHAMDWIWEQSDWPNFQYDEREFAGRNNEFRVKSERLMGRIETLPSEHQKEATIDLMLSEAIKTSAIEGEVLDRDSVRSSLLALIALESISSSTHQKEAGAAALLVDVRRKWATPLTHELLGQWQTMAVPEERLSSVMRGQYRNDPSPMQIVSGPYGYSKVHYEAPPSAQMRDEMDRLLHWYNQSSPLNEQQTSMSEIVRAGIAHLWFEIIHPFDDGNGRVGRAIADHALSQYLGYPTTACLSTAIEVDKKGYYLELEKASKDNLNITSWLDYFSNIVNIAQDIAKAEVEFVLRKTRFYDRFADQLNERQAKMVSRIFAQGRKGFAGGITTHKYESITKCSNRTASRDLSDLFEKGIVTALPGGGRSTHYELVTVERSSFGLK